MYISLLEGFIQTGVTNENLSILQKERLSCPSLTLTGERHSGYDCEKQTPRIDEEDDDLTLEEEINCPSDPVSHSNKKNNNF